MAKDQKIKCDVESCKYNANDKKLCELDEIKVSCTCDNNDVEEKKDTICQSFECDCGCIDKED